METLDPEAATLASLIPTAAELLVGQEAFALFADKEFQTGWDALYQDCPWATVFQSRAFVTTWYNNYRNEYLPVLVRARSGGRLSGLLTLALPVSSAGAGKKGGRLVGAGQYEAEYHTWLAGPANGEAFIQAALGKVNRRFPHHHLQFRFLPANTPLDWLKAGKWRQRCVLQAYNRPLMEMNHPDLPKLFRKDEFRKKLNRLKRLGELRFELVTNFKAFAAILEELTIQYDFRQGAMFNKNQFRENPLKAELLLALFRENLLHVTVLKVDEEIIASIAVVAGPDWIYLTGINIHSPYYAGYSPGFVHFLLLGQQLVQEGVAVLDLTPGEDAYKARLATTYDQVYELTVTTSRTYHFKRKLRKLFHERLIKAGKRPMTVELSLKKSLYLFNGRMQLARQQGILAALRELVQRRRAPKENAMYVLTGPPDPTVAGLALQKNNLRDLLDFDERGGRLTRWEFLEEAMRRFELGERSLTWSAGGRLLGCAWLSAPGAPPAPGLPDPEPGVNAAVLQGFYCHPAGHSRWPAFLAAVAGAARHQPQDLVYAVPRAGDTACCRALEAAGFRKAGNALFAC